MKKIIYIFIIMLAFGVCSAFAGNSKNKFNPAIAASARSVVGLVAVDASGHALVRGSGLVVADGLVVGSCHVLMTSSTSKFVIEYQHQAYSAILHKMDMPDDACSFVSKSLPATPMPVDEDIHVYAGQKVYVIGAADTGLPVIEAGELSALQKNNGMAVEKLSAAVAANVIGGAVFDARGHLIGVDCLGAGSGNKGNIALPLKEVGYLATYGVSPNNFGETYRQVNHEDLQAIDMIDHGDYAAGIKLLQPLAEKGDARAQYGLSVMYLDGYGVSKNDKKGNAWLIKSAKQGNANAEFQLGAAYVEGTGGIPKDGVKAVHWLGMAAQRSIVMAQITLGTLYIDGDKVPQDLHKGIGLIRRAADEGSGVAQFALGGAYVSGKGVKHNLIQGAKWLMLAQTHGYKRAAHFLWGLKLVMSKAKIAKARQLAKQWSAQHAF